MVAVTVSVTEAAELGNDAVAAWNGYLRQSESRSEKRSVGEKPFLWVQESPGRMNKLMQGGVAVKPVQGNGRTSVPGALIHDWIGAIYVPGATAEAALAKLDRFDDYDEFYKPTVVKSRLLGRSGNKAKFSMRWQSATFIANQVIDADYESLLKSRAPGRWWSESRSTRVQEVDAAGQPGEHLLPVGAGAGYIWRLFSITRAMDVQGGSIIEVEAIVLSRDIPTGLSWLVSPIVSRVSRNALITMLTKTREALTR
jgi:hypothetical protein